MDPILDLKIINETTDDADYCFLVSVTKPNEIRLFHSINGPAIYYHDGNYTEYYVYGKLHRLDGPARMIFGANEYYINGLIYSETDYIKYIQENHPENFPKVFAEIVGAKQ